MDFQERLLRDSKVLDGTIISVDSFLNHQLDIDVCVQIGKHLSSFFEKTRPTVVLTVEASGIVPSFLVAQNLGCRMIMARKKRSIVMQDDYIMADSFSFTKNEPIQLFLNRNYLSPDDRVLIIDDFLGNGNVVLGLINLVNQVNATIVGAGFVFEKSYLKGRSALEQFPHITTFSLVQIGSIANGKIQLLNPQNGENES